MEPCLIEYMKITAPVAGSDHNLLNFKVFWKREEINNNNDGFKYQNGKYVKIRKVLSNKCWDEKFKGKIVGLNEIWIIFSDNLIVVRDKFIPKRSLIRRSFPLWMKLKRESGEKIKRGAISITLLHIKIKINIENCETLSTKILGMQKDNINAS